MEAGAGNICYDPQAHLLKKAASLPLQMRYSLSFFTTIAHGDGASINFPVLNSSYDSDVVEEWRIKAQKLRDDAYLVGDAALREGGTYDLHLARYEAAHPGFMPQTYDDAVAFGMWQAR